MIAYNDLPNDWKREVLKAAILYVKIKRWPTTNPRLYHSI